jgi:signal transduction histidine kinase/CheY-like chemotaxis protein
VRPDGSVVWVSDSVSLMDGADGRAQSVVLIVQDISDRRQAEDDLRNLNETLEQRVAAEIQERMLAEEAFRQSQKMEIIGQLTGGVAHDFNNLLQVILGNLDALRRRIARAEVPTSGELLKLADAAARGGERAATLTQRLLAFARKQPLNPEPLEVNRLAIGMSDLLRSTIGDDIEVEMRLPANVWRVSADHNQLESAILNLAVNARDAMPSGGKITIETANTFLDEELLAERDELLPRGEYVMIALSDTGIGMSKEVMARAFDPFFTTKEIGQGTGLGLSQVYGFVKQSGGHVRIDSEPGQGTTVRLYLPRLAAVETSTSDHPQTDGIVAGSRGETILVVEDDADVRANTAAMLRELNYTVLEAADALSGLRMLGGHPEVGLLFTDLGLPNGLSGRYLGDETRRLFPRLKVLFTTGFARDTVVHHGRLDPGVDLLAKPFTYGQLAARIRQMLDEEGHSKATE